MSKVTKKKATTSGATKYTHYHKDGSVWAKGNMKSGKMHGYWEWIRKDGSMMRSGHFLAGLQIGKWTTYARNGKIVKVTVFKLKR